jgi:integrase
VLIEKVAERGATVQANRVAALLSTLFNFALDRELVETNPALRLFNREAESVRDRVLSRDEIRTLWRDLDNLPLKERSIFGLGLLTAARKSEISDASWTEFDLDLGWWAIPAARVKNKKEHRLPIVGMALQILRERRAATPENDPLVFSGETGARTSTAHAEGNAQSHQGTHRH